MRIVHAADLHVDSPLRGLDRYEGAPVERLRGATRRALENLVALCIHARADVLLLAGDVFDGAWRDYSTGLFFAAQMGKLHEAGVPVVFVRGNHDAASSVVKALQIPSVVILDHKKPQTFELRDAGIVVHGQSFTDRTATEDLAARYPARVAGAFNIGLLHTSIDGREGHAAYAPTSLETMRSRGYDYWALGHVHAREIVASDPYVVYPGNLQGRHAREIGAKGASVVTVGAGNVVESVSHHALDVVRWDVVEVDASDAGDAPEVVELARAALAERSAAADGRLLAARVVVGGATRANNALRGDLERFVSELRAAANDADGVWLEKVKVSTVAALDFDRIREEASAVGHLARRIAAIKEDVAEQTALAGALAELEKKLPPELREGEGALRLSDPATVRLLLEDVEQLLVPRLLEGVKEAG